MPDSQELLKAYLDADALYHGERERYFVTWTPGHDMPASEPVTEEVLLRLRELGDDVEAKRGAWMESLHERWQQAQANG